MKLKVSRLERDENLRAFLYHVKGIVEAAENVAELMQQMNQAYGRDVDVYAKVSSELEVEALFHLGYHMKQLRTPLRRVQRDAYTQLEAAEEKKTRGGRKKKTG
jgi:hypothetical protein